MLKIKRLHDVYLLWQKVNKIYKVFQNKGQVILTWRLRPIVFKIKVVETLTICVSECCVRKCVPKEDGTIEVKKMCTLKTPEGDFPCECICRCRKADKSGNKCDCKCVCSLEKATKIVAEDGSVKYQCRCDCTCWKLYLHLDIMFFFCVMLSFTTCICVIGSIFWNIFGNYFSRLLCLYLGLSTSREVGNRR